MLKLLVKHCLFIYIYHILNVPKWLVMGSCDLMQGQGSKSTHYISLSHTHEAKEKKYCAVCFGAQIAVELQPQSDSKCKSSKQNCKNNKESRNENRNSNNNDKDSFAVVCKSSFKINADCRNKRRYEQLTWNQKPVTENVKISGKKKWRVTQKKKKSSAEHNSNARK